MLPPTSALMCNSLPVSLNILLISPMPLIAAALLAAAVSVPVGAGGDEVLDALVPHFFSGAGSPAAPLSSSRFI
jgi:hypothetical protein